jgi:hypothetical protein
MDRAAPLSPAAAAVPGVPATAADTELPPLPPLYRSEGFAEDLLDGEPIAEGRHAHSPAAWLYVAPLGAAMLGALASTLVALT